jgi:nitroreductase
MNNAYSALQRLCEQRRSVREFADRPVADAAVEQILRIASTSPYASGRKNWEVMAIHERTAIHAIADAVRERSEVLKTQVREDVREEYAAYAQHFYAFETAGVLFVPTFRVTPALSYLLTEPDAATAQWERDTYVKSISCVALLILLAAESLGLGGCYMTGPLIAEPQIREIISCKKGREIGAILPVGYPKAGG